MGKIGRNDSCPCGSGKKYKKCCLIDTESITQEVASNEFTWRRVSQSHGKLIDKIIKFIAQTYGSIGYNEAWDAFHIWENDGPVNYEDNLFPLFNIWMFFHWSPDASRTKLRISKDIPLNLTPGDVFFKKNKHQLNDIEIEDIKENLKSYLSFYDVLECQPGAWVKIQDLLTGDYFTVQEKMGTQSMRAGNVLFGRVVTIRGITMFDGLSPVLFPASNKIPIIKLRAKMKRRSKNKVTGLFLRGFDLELLVLFFSMYNELMASRSITLVNTEGDEIVFHKMIFSIDSVENAFNNLSGLCFQATKEELLDQGARYDQDGKLKAIQFPWLGKGNKSNSQWDNTILGTINLDNDKMTVEVNSKERAKKFLTVLKKLMPNGWKLLAGMVEGHKSDLSKLEHLSKENSSFSKRKLKNLAELDDDSKMKELLIKKYEAHWDAWPTMSLPALNGKTPLEAVKTVDGREMVNALITDFEHGIQKREMPGETIETYKKLRKRLGLLGPKKGLLKELNIDL